MDGVTPAPALPVSSLPPELREKVETLHDAIAVCARQGGHAHLWATVHAARAALDAALLELVQDAERLRERLRLLDNVIVGHHSSSIMREEHHVCPVCDEAGGVQFFVDNAALYRLASPSPGTPTHE